MLNKIVTVASFCLVTGGAIVIAAIPSFQLIRAERALVLGDPSALAIGCLAVVALFGSIYQGFVLRRRT